MKLQRLESTALIQAPVDDVWEFFSNPQNLPVITPPWLGLELTSEQPPRMHPGLIITYKVRPIANIPLGWVTEITHVVEKQLFVDEQRSGPYKFWHHQHHFRPVDGGTEMRDIVHWALPAGPLGNLIAGRDVRRRVQGIFDYRANVIRERYEDRSDPRTVRRPAMPSGTPLTADS
jgi:ligand-binding SRPBCC domain-containing protein